MEKTKREMRQDAIERLHGMIDNPPYGLLCADDIPRALVGDGWSDSTVREGAETIIDLLTDDEPPYPVNWLDNATCDQDGVLWLNGDMLSGDTITAPLMLNNTIRSETVRTATQREDDLIDLLRDAARDYVRLQTYYKGLLRAYNRFCENNFMQLPRDANGEVIHVGDEMVCGDHVFMVGGVGHESGVGVVYYTTGDGHDAYVASVCRHYHKPTMKDVIWYFLHATDDAIRRGQKELPSEVFDEFIAKLKEV